MDDVTVSHVVLELRWTHSFSAAKCVFKNLFFSRKTIIIIIYIPASIQIQNVLLSLEIYLLTLYCVVHFLVKLIYSSISQKFRETQE